MINKDDFRQDLIELARRSTEAADMEFHDHGKRIDRRPETHLEYTIVVERDQNSTQGPDTLFADTAKATKRTSAKKSKTKKKRKTARR